ncbi:MAG: Cas10/Cmr2 second palm domain-containing protein [Candidatus Nanopelagicales bacterium]
MNTYLDLGVGRIQEYINRTAAAEDVLKRRRGASRMVRAATELTAFDLGSGNDETYDTEGVAHLILLPGRDPAQAARRALAGMRAHLRYAYLEASWAQAPDYASAAKTLERVRNGESVAGAGHLVSLPPAREDALAARCSSCGSGIADQGGECRDCRARTEAGSRPRGRGKDGPSRTAEEEAIKRIECREARELSPIPDLTSLARLPECGGNKRNHLATIYADGNNIGGLFHGLRMTPEVARRVSRILDETIKNAGDSALRKLLSFPHSTAACLPGAITTLAADDVVITVPAPWGWAFVTTLVETFNRLIAERLGNAEVAVATQPSLTAGLVFSHYKHPIEVAITRAAAQMRQAKQAERGRAAAIGWVDLTQQSAGTGFTRPFEWFVSHRADLDSLAALTGSQRGRLAHQLRVFRTELGSGNPALAAEMAEYLLQDAQRNGIKEVLAPFLETLPTEGALAELQAGLSVGQWWAAGESI